MRIPKPLHAGDTLALIGISGCVRGEHREESVARAAEKLTNLGFKVKLDPSVYEAYGYLSGSDAERARALNDAFADDTVDGIWCIRGGYGVARMLDLVDFEQIDRCPKAVIGYSDITALHAALESKCGLCSFHGPMPLTDRFDGGSLDSLLHAIGGEPDKELRNLDGTALQCMHGGVAEGELVGGNLSLVSSLCGTAYLPDMTGKLLFLEDVGERTYVLDRYLTQLRMNGLFDKCAGVILGAFTDCVIEHEDAGLTLEQVLGDVLADVHVPMVAGLQCGHIAEKPTLALGRRYRLDADAGQITLR